MSFAKNSTLNRPSTPSPAPLLTREGDRWAVSFFFHFFFHLLELTHCPLVFPHRDLTCPPRCSSPSVTFLQIILPREKHFLFLGSLLTRTDQSNPEACVHQTHRGCVPVQFEFTPEFTTALFLSCTRAGCSLIVLHLPTSTSGQGHSSHTSSLLQS